MHNDYTHIPREVQLPRFPVFDAEEEAHLKMLARDYYGLRGEEVKRFIRLTALLDYYAAIVDATGSLDERQQRAQTFALGCYEKLLSPPRNATFSRAA